MEQVRIGPNSIIQTVEALKEHYGYSRTVEILHQGGYLQLMDNLPSTMVAEQEFVSLATMLIHQLGSEQAGNILNRSGQRTAFYLLKHRIPPFFQYIVKHLPRGAGFTLLLMAIGKNAWTFVGSGRFSFVGGKAPRIMLFNRSSGHTVPPEACRFYAGTFETLLRELLGAQATVEEIRCPASDEIRCAYAVSYRSP